MEPRGQPRWLDATYLISMTVIVGVVGITFARELRRPARLEQRVVPALAVVDRCEMCHDAGHHTGMWISSHPVERFGCTPCHGGQGLATTRQDAHEARPDWERPLYTALERQAACARCHEDAPEGAPLLEAGRRAIEARGCTGCHDLPGFPKPTIAPELDGLRDKVSPAWVRAWLSAPDAAPKRKMPRFRLEAEEVEALTSFLFTLDGPAMQPMSPELRGDADRGKIAVAQRRCATCHVVEGRGGTAAVSLDYAGAKIKPEWLFSYLTDTHRLRPSTRMPGFRIPAAEAADIVAYAAEQLVPDSDKTPWAPFEAARAPHPELAERGRKLFVELGCRGCHVVASIPFTRAGVALTGIGDRRIGDLPRNPSRPAAPDVPSWIALKMEQPDGFDPPGRRVSRMPSYELEPAEAQAIGVVVASVRAARAPERYLRRPPAGVALPTGATGELVERFRCLVCHRVGRAGGDISRVPLDGEASRVRRPWLDHFLSTPGTIRMDQAERMPVLGIEPADATRLANWIEASLADPRLAAVAPFTPAERDAGKASFAARGCPSCHLADGQGTMKGPVLDGAGDRLTPAYLVGMLRHGPSVVPERRHPMGALPDSEARAIAAYVASLELPKSKGR